MTIGKVMAGSLYSQMRRVLLPLIASAGYLTMGLTHVTVASECIATVPDVVQKKYISFGWEFKHATPEQLLSNADKLRGKAMDGVGIYLSATNSKGQLLRFVCKGDKWEREPFKSQMPALRQIAKTKGLSESFIVGFSAPETRFAWTDDARWDNLANSMSVLGWICRESGIKGVSNDTEDYYKQMQYYRLPDDPEWEELVKIARRRGKQVFGALFKEKPDIRLLFYWALTIDRDYFTTTDVKGFMKSKGDLWPAFFDGILDAMPPEATIIDGDEHAYSYEARLRGYHKSYFNQRTICPLLVSPENRARYLRQAQVSFGVYLDAYVNESGPWYFGPENGSRTRHLRRNLRDATDLATEFVWFWGERNVTVHWDGIRLDNRVSRRDKTWNDAIPGLDAMMLGCKDRDGGVSRRMEELQREGKLEDLVSNPGCKADRRSPYPSPYSYWHAAIDTNTVFFIDKNEGCASSPSLAIKGTKSGVILLEKTNASPGEVYVVDVSVKGESIKAKIAFKQGGDWQRGTEDVGFIFGEADSRGWRNGRAVVAMPLGTDAFDLIIGSRVRSDDNVIHADDFHIYRIW